MQDTAHTPGGWKLLPPEEPGNYWRIRGTALGRHYKIANVPTIPGAPKVTNDETKANARLIAASPELLEALQEMLEAYAPHAQDTVNKFGENALHSGVKRARAAIAKATGKAQP